MNNPDLDTLRNKVVALQRSITDLERLGADYSALEALRAQVAALQVQIQTQGGAVVGESVETGRDFVGRDQYNFNLTIAATSWARCAPLLSPEALQAATESYLNYLLDRHRYLSSRGWASPTGCPLRLPLLDLYVPLKARLTLPEGETWQRGLHLAGRRLSEEEQEALTGRLGEPQPVLDLLQAHDGLIILGDPGAGKTTFLKVLALRLALGEGEALGLNHRLPVLVPLSAYANALAEEDVRLDDFIADYFHDIGADLAHRRDAGGGVCQRYGLILLDGLDEVKDPARATRWSNGWSISTRSTGGRATSSCSPAGSSATGRCGPRRPGLAECTLIDFDDEEIEAFVTRWTRALERQALGEGAAARRRRTGAGELLDAIRRNPGVRRLAANPLLLTILALMKRQGVVLPERRVELYDQYVRTMLSSWNRARGLGRPPIATWTWCRRCACWRRWRCGCTRRTPAWGWSSARRCAGTLRKSMEAAGCGGSGEGGAALPGRCARARGPAPGARGGR